MLLLDDTRYHEETVFTGRRIGNYILTDAAIGHDIGAQAHPCRNNRGHRLNVLRIDFVELFDKGQNGVEFFAHRLDAVVLKPNTGQMCNAAHGIAVYAQWGKPWLGTRKLVTCTDCRKILAG